MNTALSLLRNEPHISVSALRTYAEICPQQYFHRYILKTPPSHRASALAFGSAIHRALEVHYSALRDGLPELSKGALCSAFRDAWTFQLEGELPVLFSEKESADSLTDTGIKMMEIFLEKAPRYPKVVEVEMPWGIDLLTPECEVMSRLVGVFDAVVVKENDSSDHASPPQFEILEHKSSMKRWTEQKLRDDIQISGYALVAPLVGLGNASIRIQVLTKGKTPDFIAYDTIRTEADANDFGLLAFNVTKAIEAGAFWKNHSWWCNGCAYAYKCLPG